MKYALNDRIFHVLFNRGISSAAFARGIGVTPTTVNSWKTNKTAPQADVIPRIAIFLNISTDYLFGLIKEERTLRMNISLPDSLIPPLRSAAARHGARRLVLFGSRARGDHRERSDIDLAVYGMPASQRGAFWLELEELPTLLKLDIVHISPDMDPTFLQNIEKDGVTIYASEN